MKILLTEGSGVTSRQVAGRLSSMGHHVEVLTSDPLCLARFTRHVQRLHRVPKYGEMPIAWLRAALDVFHNGAFDVLFPTQEQVAVLAAANFTTAVPSFSALLAVQDKVSAFATLNRLNIPQPPSAVFTSISDLHGWCDFPAYVKQPIGTASTAVRRIETEAELGTVDIGSGALVQQAVDGPLAMVQSVFFRGELVASHANLRVRVGANGGASHKQSIDDAEIRTHLITLGKDLNWHGALSADVILTTNGPMFIDINPRIVEPINAWQSGVDLVGAMLDVALGSKPNAQQRGKPGQRTHQTVLAVLGAAQTGRGRKGIAAELIAAARHQSDYANSTEEMTPWRGDRLSAVPLVMAAATTLIRPSWWQWFVSGSVSAYALTPAAWAEIQMNLPGLKSATQSPI
jgi:ATP-grasp domain